LKNAKAEDSPQNAHRADDVATRAVQDQTQQLHDVYLKAKVTRERIAATAIQRHTSTKGTRQRKEEERDERGRERSRIQQERKHINTPNTSALNTSEESTPTMTCCLFAMIHLMQHL
jgi:hypothetical protein